MSDQQYIERCLRQYKSHTRTRNNGDKVVSLGLGLYDLFSGTGWKNHTRFRIVRLRDKTKQLVVASGFDLSREYRNELLSEN